MSTPILHIQDAQIFQEQNMVLQDVNLSLNKGEFIYLIGKTGSGKSSLMKTLFGELPLRVGNGQIVGYNLAGLKEADIPFLRRKIGMVFQDFKLLPDRSVEKNLHFVLQATGWKDPQEINAKAQEVLDKVGMKTKGFKFPHELSGGEQQRVAIARALLNDPELILADEPTGNLDPQTSVEVMKVLMDIHESGRSILMSTHDYALLLKFPFKTLKCDGGQIFEVVQKAL
ncbi:ATP-binding cassette domain-containing protein [Flavobacteriaceae bacterium LSUCC0859]|nr:ATP-binding cassette domain-containing protein [Flavobacteriaceae bacterium LSUCC0859]